MAEAVIEGMMIVGVGVVVVIVTPEITTIAVITMIVDTAVIMDAAMTMIVVVTTIAVLVVDSSIHIGTPVSCTSAQLVSMRYFTGQLGLDTLVISFSHSVSSVTRLTIDTSFHSLRIFLGKSLSYNPARYCPNKNVSNSIYKLSEFHSLLTHFVLSAKTHHRSNSIDLSIIITQKPLRKSLIATVADVSKRPVSIRLHPRYRISYV